MFLVVLVSSCDLSKYKLTKDYNFMTVFEKSKGKKTATYAEVIGYYEDLADAYGSVSISTFGKTDSGKPLHLVVYNPEKKFNFEKIDKDKRVLFINNGIHPGESDGIDATMLLLRDYAQDSIETPKNTIIATIPVYNIGGALNRNSTSRVNQNGPAEYGFRGNARNYDLNRDFIKSDTRNMLAFAEIFHTVNPDFFIDNHVSNGADYQYVLTHLFTQPEKLGGKLGRYMQRKFRLALEDSLAKSGFPITPYVNVFNQKPETGFVQFLDSPRYSTGYAALWNTPGMMVETHMLKSYEKRVRGNYELMKSVVQLMDSQGQEIDSLRSGLANQFQKKSDYYFNYVVDSTQVDTLQFKGYEAETKTSSVTSLKRLQYNRNKPFTRPVSYYDHFKPSDTVSIPKAYIIPQGWWRVVELLKINKIEMTPLEKDTVLQVESYHIADYKTRKKAFEGHYPHYDTKLKVSSEKIKFRKGDIRVKTHQEGLRYLLETLEPMATDSFFNWNFFDTILQQKEGFSPYVFEDLAVDFLKDHPAIKKEFEAKKAKDPAFRKSSYDQLQWIQRESPFYEKAHLRYPIFRVPK